MDYERMIANLIERFEHRYYGKYRGLVVDNADPEQLGRLKLHVPSVLGNAVVTGWAMPCAPYGGEANQGFLFIPPSGAGVWVEFEEGDLEFPIWSGTFWSKPAGKSELPKPNEADGQEQGEVQAPPTRKVIKTLKGHAIQFEDADDQEMVLIIEATNGHVVRMNKEGIMMSNGINGHQVLLDGEGIVITDGKNKHRIALQADGVTIESAADLTITATNINLEATAKLTAKGNPIHLNP